MAIFIFLMPMISNEVEEKKKIRGGKCGGIFQNRVGGGFTAAVLSHTWTPPFAELSIRDNTDGVEIAAIHPDFE